MVTVEQMERWVEMAEAMDRKSWLAQELRQEMLRMQRASVNEKVTEPTEPTKYAAVSLIVRADGRMLCVWNKRYKGWSMPGGKVEDNETFEEAQSRELYEETGIVDVDMGPCVWRHHATFEFAGMYFDQLSGLVLPNGTEIAEGCPVVWMTREDFLDNSPFALFYRKVFEELGIAQKAEEPARETRVSLEPTTG